MRHLPHWICSQAAVAGCAVSWWRWARTSRQGKADEAVTVVSRTLDLDRLLAGLMAELTIAAERAQMDSDTRRAVRRRQAPPRWLQQALGTNPEALSEVFVASQPTVVMRVELRVEADVQLPVSPEESPALDGPVLLRVVSATSRSTSSVVARRTSAPSPASSHMLVDESRPDESPTAPPRTTPLCIYLDGAAGGEVRVGAFAAAIVAGRRLEWRRWKPLLPAARS